MLLERVSFSDVDAGQTLPRYSLDIVQTGQV